MDPLVSRISNSPLSSVKSGLFTGRDCESYNQTQHSEQCGQTTTCRGVLSTCIMYCIIYTCTCMCMYSMCIHLQRACTASPIVYYAVVSVYRAATDLAAVEGESEELFRRTTLHHTRQSSEPPLIHSIVLRHTNVH